MFLTGGLFWNKEARRRLDNTTGRPYIMNEDEFEWNTAKAVSNLVKHGVSLEAARSVFDDVFAFERCDFDSATGEIR
jgi:hypothetical protein